MRFIFIVSLCLLLCGCLPIEDEEYYPDSLRCKHDLQMITNCDGVTRIWCPLCKHYVRGFVVSTPYDKCDSTVLGVARAKAFCKGIPYTYFQECDSSGLQLIHYHNIFVSSEGVIYLDYVSDKYLKELEEDGYIQI